MSELSAASAQPARVSGGSAGSVHPTWPNWRSWSLADRPLIDALLGQLDAPYSDVSFGSCYAWDVTGAAQWTTVGGNLVLRMPDYSTREPVYVLAGMQAPAQTAVQLLASGSCSRLSLVPACVAEQCRDNGRLEVVASPDNDDYIYDTTQISALADRSLQSVKREQTRFRRSYPDHRVVRDQGADIAVDNIRNELLAVFDSWSLASTATENTATERAALVRLIDAAHCFDLLLTRIYIADMLLAFSLDELLPNGWALGCFLKADRRVRDPFVEVNVQAAQGLAALGARWINNEQDLGLLGLRASKQRWGPVRMLRKYTIKLARESA